MLIRNFTLSLRDLGGSADQIEFISVAETCVVIYVDNHQNVLLVRQFRDIFNSHTLELPGGGREAGEGSTDCAIREFREETGIQLRRVQLLTTAALSVGTSNEIVSIYLAGEADRLSRGVHELECRSVPLVECLALLDQEIIKDAKTLLGVALARSTLLV